MFLTIWFTCALIAFGIASEKDGESAPLLAACILMGPYALGIQLAKLAKKTDDAENHLFDVSGNDS